MVLLSLTDKEIVKDLGQKFKGYRLHLNKTQQEIANHIGISVLTVSNFERGKNTEISLKIFIKLLRAIKQLESIRQILPEIPMSPKMIVKMQGKHRQRSSKKKKS